jgi:methyl-accepting chemotaxis protein
MNLNKLSFRTKIYLLIAPLFLVVTVLGVYLNYEVYAEWKNAESLKTQALKEQRFSILIHELQKERGKSVLFFNKTISKQDLEKQRQKVDWARQNLFALMNGDETSVRISEKIKSARVMIETAESTKAFIQELTALVDVLIKTQVALFDQEHFRGEENRFSSLAIFEKAKESMGLLRARMNLIFGQNMALSAKDLEAISALKASISANLESPGLNLTENGQEQLKSILESAEWKKILSRLDIVVEKSATGHYGIEANEFFLLMTTQIDKVFAVIQDEQKAALDNLDSFIQSMKKEFMVSSAVFLFVLFIASYFSFMLINAITENLKKIIVDLNDTTPKLAGSADFLNSLSADLSSCSTEQAAAVQETASGLEEVFGMINKNAENAVLARTSSLESMDQVKKGQNSVHTMVSALSEISKSHEQLNEFIQQNNKDLEGIINVITDIASKTKVINDIVFQTKLLSFNASVEAARAGDQGKGFSVVAEEIGNLAVMSGQSANEMSGLLESSIGNVKKIIETTRLQVEKISMEGKEKVKDGVQKAEVCSEALKTIFLSVEKVESIIEEVSEASGEQSKGIAEINKAMSQIDQVTHQNSQSSHEVSKNSGQVLQLSGSIKTSSERLLVILNGKAS